MNSKDKHQVLLNNKDIIISKEEQGVAIFDIAKEYNVHIITLYAFLRRCGVDIKNGRSVIKNKEEIIRQYHGGVSVEIIAKEQKVSQVTIYKYLLQWRVREKRERIVSEGERERRKSTIILSFEQRVSPELLCRMKENTKINKKYSSRYSYIEKEDRLVYNFLKQIGVKIIE